MFSSLKDAHYERLAYIDSMFKCAFDIPEFKNDGTYEIGYREFEWTAEDFASCNGRLFISGEVNVGIVSSMVIERIENHGLYYVANISHHPAFDKHGLHLEHMIRLVLASCELKVFAKIPLTIDYAPVAKAFANCGFLFTERYEEEFDFDYLEFVCDSHCEAQ